MTLPSIDTVLNYTNPRILKRYEKDYPNNTLKAEEAFQELLKYFWLCQKCRTDRKTFSNDESLNFSVAMHQEMKEIDDMWHTFILFTKDYADFCQRYFENFIHHDPTDEENAPSPEQFEKDLTQYLSYIYDNLGEDTVRKWFKEYE